MHGAGVARWYFDSSRFFNRHIHNSSRFKAWFLCNLFKHITILIAEFLCCILLETKHEDIFAICCDLLQLQHSNYIPSSLPWKWRQSWGKSSPATELLISEHWSFHFPFPLSFYSLIGEYANIGQYPETHQKGALLKRHCLVSWTCRMCSDITIFIKVYCLHHFLNTKTKIIRSIRKLVQMLTWPHWRV